MKDKYMYEKNTKKMEIKKIIPVKLKEIDENEKELTAHTHIHTN